MALPFHIKNILIAFNKLAITLRPYSKDTLFSLSTWFSVTPINTATLHMALSAL